MDEKQLAKIKEIRKQILGMAILKTLAQTDDNIHIHYHKEGC